MLRRVLVTRRPGSRASSSGKSGRTGLMGWVEQRRDKIIHVCLSGISVVLSMQLVNNSHRADDREAELLGALKHATRTRQQLLRRAPQLARDAGLPAAAQPVFEASLLGLAAQLDSDADGMSETPTVVSPPNASDANCSDNGGAGDGAAGTAGSGAGSGAGGPSKKGIAVW